MAGIAQLVEYKLPKLGVASSNLAARSTKEVRSRHLYDELRTKLYLIMCSVSLIYFSLSYYDDLHE